MLPHHQPEVADGGRQRSLCENVFSLRLFHFHEIRIYVVDIAAVQHDSRMVVWTDVAISVELPICYFVAFVQRELFLLRIKLGPLFDFLEVKGQRN